MSRCLGILENTTRCKNITINGFCNLHNSDEYLSKIAYDIIYENPNLYYTFFFTEPKLCKHGSGIKQRDRMKVRKSQWNMILLKMSLYPNLFQVYDIKVCERCYIRINLTDIVNSLTACNFGPSNTRTPNIEFLSLLLKICEDIPITDQSKVLC